MRHVPLSWLIAGSFVSVFLLGLGVASCLVYSSLYHTLWMSGVTGMENHLRYVLGDTQPLRQLDDQPMRFMFTSGRPIEVPDDYTELLDEIATQVSSDSFLVNLLDANGKLLSHAPQSATTIALPDSQSLTRLKTRWENGGLHTQPGGVEVERRSGEGLRPPKNSNSWRNNHKPPIGTHRWFKPQHRHHPDPPALWFGEIPHLPLFLFPANRDEQNGLFGPLRLSYSPSYGRQTLVVPLAHNGKLVGFAQITGSWMYAIHFLDGFARLITIGAVVIGLVISLVGFWLTRVFTTPLSHLAHTATQVAEGDLRSRTGLLDGRNEVYKLGATFDMMIDKLEASLCEQQRFIGDASHELKTPLTSLLGSAHVLRILEEESPNTKRSQTIDTMERELNRMTDIVTDLLTLSRNTELRHQKPSDPCNIAELLSDAVQSSLASSLEREVKVTNEADTWILADQKSLTRAVRNIIDNALRYSNKDSVVTIETHCNNINVSITVSDQGVGIAPEHLKNLGKRFYRSDSGRDRKSGGTGLGLAITAAIVERHSGELTFASTVGQGTQVTITLPLLRDEAVQ